MAFNNIGNGIFVGSLYALEGINDLKKNGITGILSLIPGGLSTDVQYKLSTENGFLLYSVNDLDDEEDEDILRILDYATEFVYSIVNNNTSCLIHCIAGISRSVTVAAAYFIRYKNMTAFNSIQKIKKSRSIANPNKGFIKQLEIYEEIYLNSSDNEKARTLNSKQYRQFKLENKTKLALQTGTPPLIENYLSEQEQQSSVLLRCKRCRQSLANSMSIMNHKPEPNGYDFTSSIEISQKQKHKQKNNQCMHYFLQPVKWMQKELELGKLEGKFLCPKCNSKIGSYKWQGLLCTCGTWVTPALELQRGKVDEIKYRLC